jgi:type IV pilus assembly protein PilM
MAFFAKKNLGIDIGTSAIKIIELSRRGERVNLENYGEIKGEAFYAKSFRTFEKNVLSLSQQDIARAIKAVLEEAKIKTKKCVFTIPDFTTFFTTFELPPMSESELPQAVTFEARQHVPLPISEVTLDWKVIEGVYVGKEKTKLKILLVAVPNELVNQYQTIALASNLELNFLVAEAFSLVKSLTSEEEKGVILIVDIGSQSTTCSVVERRILKISYSFDISANQFTDQISRGLMVDYKTAENLKQKYGLLTVEGPSLRERANIRNILSPLIDELVKEVERSLDSFYQMEGKKARKIVLAGGSALLPGLLEYFRDHFKIEVEIANPFSRIFYPPILEEKLKEMGPPYAVAVGAALEGLE